MNETGNGARLQAILWLVLGALLVLMFFLPLYESPLYDMNGIETFDFVRDMPNDKMAKYDAFTGILMLGVPVLSLLTGIMAVVFGLATVGGKAKMPGLGLSVVAGLTLVLALVCVVKLDAQASGFFRVFLPRAALGFYVMVFFLLCLAIAGPVLRAVRKK